MVNVFNIAEYRKNEVLSQYTLDFLSPHTGSSCAHLLHLLGYETVRHLVSASDAELKCIPFIGEKKFQKIECALAMHSLSIPKFKKFSLDCPSPPKL